MNAIFPFALLEGQSHLAMVLTSLGLGVVFGFFLERSGFGSAKNLTSIFILRDFRVFRVMFSAVITAMLGLLLFADAGVLNMNLLEYDATFFWPMLAGGLLFGVGFYVGGYCPGTAAVALARGRWDGAVFLFGIVLGIYGFALLFDQVGQAEWFVAFFSPADAVRQTLAGDGPVWPWAVGLTAVAIAAFKVVPWVERRFALRTVDGERPEPPAITGRVLTVGPALAGVAAVAVVALELSSPPSVPAPRPAAVAVDEAEQDLLPPLTLASWVVSEAHRRAEKSPPNTFVVDLRGERARASAAVPGASPLDVGDGTAAQRLERALEGLGDLVAPAARNKPLVLVDADESPETLALASGLRRYGFNAQVLEGGFQAWRQQVLESEVPLFALAFERVVPPSEPVAAEGPADGQAEGEPVAAEGTADGQTEGEEAQSENGDGQASDEAESADHAAPAPAPEPEPMPEIDLAGLNTRLRRWLAGREEGLPPRLALPGAVLLPAKASTVRARGGSGGGCG